MGRNETDIALESLLFESQSCLRLGHLPSLLSADFGCFEDHDSAAPCIYIDTLYQCYLSANQYSRYWKETLLRACEVGN